MTEKPPVLSDEEILVILGNHWENFLMAEYRQKLVVAITQQARQETAREIFEEIEAEVFGVNDETRRLNLMVINENAAYEWWQAFKDRLGGNEPEIDEVQELADQRHHASDDTIG